jgi:hypothetical protein
VHRARTSAPYLYSGAVLAVEVARRCQQVVLRAAAQSRICPACDRGARLRAVEAIGRRSTNASMPPARDVPEAAGARHRDPPRREYSIASRRERAYGS